MVLEINWTLHEQKPEISHEQKFDANLSLTRYLRDCVTSYFRF